MKRIFTLFSILLSSSILLGQSVLYEDFSSGSMPPQGWTVEGQNNWRISNSSNAGATAPEGKLTWTPQFNGLTRLVSPQIDLSGAEKAVFIYKYNIDHYSGTYSIGVSTRSGGGAWSDVHTLTVNSNISASDLLVVIDNADVGSASFQFSIFFSGNSYNINDWYFDNIELLIPADLDLAMVSVDVPSYFVGEQDVTGDVANFGLENINSFDLNWQIDEGEISTTSVSGLNLEIGEKYSYQSDQVLSIDPGTYSLKVWVSNVNNLGDDDVPDNDMIEQSIGIPTQTVDRRPLFEEFTSSTCGPCATFNNGVFNAFVEQNADIITLVKYQMNWPGSGDPYYTPEGGVRRDYYGVNAVPMLFTDGRSTPTNSAGVNNALNTSLGTPAFVVLDGQHIIDNTTVTAQVNVTSFVNLQNVTLHMIVIEKLTTGNVGSNGETSFKHVMMKMMPDADGSNISVEAEVPYQLTLSANMDGTNVEEMDDLMVVLFLQDDSNKSIFQSAYSTEVGAFITFDPEPGTNDLFTDIDLFINFSQEVRMLGGAEITSDNLGSIISLVDGEGDPFPFVATINPEKTEIMISPEGLLNSYTMYYLTVDPVENIHSVPTLVSTSHFETGMHVVLDELHTDSFVIYPNPAKDQLYLKFRLEHQERVNIALYNLSGKLIDKIDLGLMPVGNHRVLYHPSDEINNGFYLLQFFTPSLSKTKRLIINK